MKKILIFLFVSTLAFKVFADDVSASIANSAFGSNNGSVTLTLSAGVAPFTFSWTGPDGFVSTEQDITDLAPGEYCVTVTDMFCGTATLCATVEEEPFQSIENNPMRLFEVFPNPFNSTIVVSFSTSAFDNYTFTLTDNNGKVVKTQISTLAIGEHEVSFAVPLPIAAGTYQLSITDMQLNIIKKQLIHIK